MKDELTPFGLYDPELEHSACGVGFLTRKDGAQTHDLLRKGHEALCAVPHRGGMSSEGVGDGAGVSVDLSIEFFSKLVGKPLEKGAFGVGNFFMPVDIDANEEASVRVSDALFEAGFKTLTVRDLPVNNSAIGERAVKWQLP
ncbi:MAG: hypothetical protein AAFU69_04945, partial [Pseudomonadota bacterium]